RAEHERLGLGDRFNFLGFRTDALRILAGSDIFVLASHHEGFPVAVMEALALGVPAVATAVGAIPEALAGGADGVVVPPGRADLLADALRSLVFDPERRKDMSAAAREAGRQYDIHTTVNRLEAIYDELAGASRDRST